MKSFTQKTLPGFIIALVGLAMLSVLVISIRASAAGTVTVSGNTSAGENQPGWMFNRLGLPTPYTFTMTASSLGSGSLYAGPISAEPSDRFVSEYFPGSLLVADFKTFSYDFKIGQGGDVGDTGQFYLSVYANIDASTNDYDCRYDYVARSGSVDAFSKAIIFTGEAPTRISRGGDRISSCPTTLEGMPTGSYIRVFSLGMGDTTADDAGLDGYFDNLELVLNGDSTGFNFEAAPRTKEDCANNGWKTYKFKNQGQCQKSVGN